MTSVLRSERACWTALAIALAAILLMQIWAGLTLRGLYADGAYYAEQLLLRQSFSIVEPARWTAQVLMQAPVVLAIRLGQDSPYAVALAFSLASNLLPLALTLACLATLPAADRAYGLFPVLIFLATSMSAAFASVAVGPTAAAYAWLLLLLILFGPLTILRLAAIPLLAAGTLRLDEAMAFLGPILVFACLWRGRSAEGRIARSVLTLAALLIAAGAACACHDVLHPWIVANRTSLIGDLESLRWLSLGGGQINVMAIAGLAGIMVMPLVTLRLRCQAPAMSAAALVFIALALLALAEPPCPPAAFAARDNACLLTAPAMVLLLILRGRGWRLPARSAALMAMLGLTIATADGAATAGWQRYTSAMRTAIATTHGIVPWRDAQAELPPPQATALLRYAWPWTTPLMSFWLAPGSAIGTIIANPGAVAWEPFDPYALWPALAAEDSAPARAAFVALLKRSQAHGKPSASHGYLFMGAVSLPWLLPSG